MEIAMIVVSIQRFLRENIPLRLITLISNEEDGYVISAGLGVLTKDENESVSPGKRVKVTIEDV